jgi:hypothetical protein
MISAQHTMRCPLKLFDQLRVGQMKKSAMF